MSFIVYIRYNVSNETYSRKPKLLYLVKKLKISSSSIVNNKVMIIFKKKLT
jgi:hypothetical protein